VLGPAALDLPALTRVARGKILSCDDAWRTSVGSISGASAMHEHDEVLEQLKSWQDSGHRVAVATVVSTWGSSPRPVGSQLGVNDAGEMVGSVSGGCIEGAVVKEALEVMAGAAQAARLRRLQRAGLGGRPRLRRQARGLHRGRGLTSPAAPRALDHTRPGNRGPGVGGRLIWRWFPVRGHRARGQGAGQEHIRLPPLAIDKVGRLPA
jgi:hypothetical protein